MLALSQLTLTVEAEAGADLELAPGVEEQQAQAARLGTLLLAWKAAASERAAMAAASGEQGQRWGARPVAPGFARSSGRVAR